MISPRFSRSWIGRAVPVATALLAGLLLGRPAGAVPGDEVLLAPTPLILRDGRIANVSVHTVPFAAGAAGLADPAARALAVLTRDAATDCFLTAQVIGHVGVDEISRNETLTAHRLARSRADAVQAALIGGGLPAKAIASVWDWQFMVQEARATLWLFSLTIGEDCEGAPLVPGADAVVARAEPAPGDDTPAPAAAAASVAPSVAPDDRDAPAPRTAAPPQAADRGGGEPSEPVIAAPAGQSALAQGPANRPSAVATTLAGPASADPTTAGTRTAVPAMSPRESAPREPSDPAPAQGATVAALGQPSSPAPAEKSAAPARNAAPPARKAPEPSQQAVAPAQPAAHEAGGVSQAGQGALAITFATNSSYFPPGTTQRLRDLLADLEGGQRYRVRLQAAVSGSDSVVGASSTAEAARYNKWLAERRLERVTNWLQERAKGHELIIEPQFLAGDSSRRVIVEISPAG